MSQILAYAICAFASVGFLVVVLADVAWIVDHRQTRRDKLSPRTFTRCLDSTCVELISVSPEIAAQIGARPVAGYGRVDPVVFETKWNELADRHPKISIEIKKNQWWRSDATVLPEGGLMRRVVTVEGAREQLATAEWLFETDDEAVLFKLTHEGTL